VKAIIDSEYTFEQAAEAHTKMLKGKGLFGKILMTLSFKNYWLFTGSSS